MTLWFGTFVMLFCASGHVVHQKTLEDERYIVIKAYKFAALTFSYYHILSVRAIPTYSLLTR